MYISRALRRRLHMALLACGDEFYVALTEHGGLVVRGANERGQLGIGTLAPALRPAVLGGVGPVAGDAAGELIGGEHALALLALPLAPLTPLADALAHPFEGMAAMVSAGTRHVLCVTDGGVVWAWGCNNRGQLGVDAPAPGCAVRPIRWPAHLCHGALVRMVACGFSHTLVLTRGGQVWACGNGSRGQTGSLRLPARVLAPERVLGLPAMALVAAGRMHCSAVGMDGQVWMWGCGVHMGYLQAPAPAPARPTPMSLGLGAFAGARVVLLDLRADHAAAVTELGALWVWGGNDYGQLGLGNVAARDVPVNVALADGSGVCMASFGYGHQVVLASDGAVWTSGDGSAGVLGLGDLVDRWVPTRIAPQAFGGAKIVFVAGGAEDSFAVTAEGLLYTWGTAHPRATAPPQTRPLPVAISLAPGARVGRSCALPRRHSLALCMGASPLSHVSRDVLGAVLAHVARLGGDYAHMGEGLLRRLAVRVRTN